jgi:hypothetical protein
VLTAMRPIVLVDAPMRKRNRLKTQHGLAPLTIGLGPNFVVGKTVDLAVETAWGEALGRVVTHGATRPLRGIGERPGRIADGVLGALQMWRSGRAIEQGTDQSTTN